MLQVRWKGYGKESDSWESAEDLSGAKDAIAAFNKRGDGAKETLAHSARGVKVSHCDHNLVRCSSNPSHQWPLSLV